MPGAAAAARDERVPDRLGGRGADPGREPQAALQRELVAGVPREAQVREHVLHVRRLEEAHAAADDERDAAPRELELDLHRVVVRAVEDRDLGERDALVAQLEHALRDERRLLLHVAAGHERRAASRRRARS